MLYFRSVISSGWIRIAFSVREASQETTNGSLTTRFSIDECMTSPVLMFLPERITGWWLNQPIWKNTNVNLDRATPRFGLKIPKMFELPPPRNNNDEGDTSLNCHLFSIHRLDTKPWGILNSGESWGRWWRLTTPWGARLKGIYGCFQNIGVSPNHPILIGFSIINHPFWGTTIFGNTLYIPNEYPCDTRCVWGWSLMGPHPKGTMNHWQKP